MDEYGVEFDIHGSGDNRWFITGTWFPENGYPTADAAREALSVMIASGELVSK